jgi:hypothetical protein
MKKVKIALAAIAVFAVVSGSLAFKAKSAFTYFTSTSSGTGNCSTIAHKFDSGSGTDPFYFTSTTSGGDCNGTSVQLHAE